MKLKRHKTVDALLADALPGDKEIVDAVNKSYFEDAMANQLFILRTKAGLSQKDMAKRLKVSQSVISKMENKGDYLKFNDVIRYVNALGCSVEMTIVKNGRAIDFLASYFARIKRTMGELQELAGKDPDITKGIMSAFLAFSTSMIEDVIPQIKGKLPQQQRQLEISINPPEEDAKAKPKKTYRKKETQVA